MTYSEAIIQAIKNIGEWCSVRQVYEYIDKEGIMKPYNTKTPDATVSLTMFDMSKRGRLQCNREVKPCLFQLPQSDIENSKFFIKKEYKERDLHPILTSYLLDNNICVKTIYHERSCKKDDTQKWVHPDVVGVKFIEYSNPLCQSMFRSTNRINTIEMYSYELKKQISNDSELKKYFFQAVSNSSWANYGYLVAHSIDTKLMDELKRLNHSFGIGVILLNNDISKTEVLFQARRNELDFSAIDKLCNINKDFRVFIEKLESVISSDEKIFSTLKESFWNICDKPIESLTDYCIEKGM